MPRTSRIVLPDYPHHVIQRGHNRQAVFADAADYLYYLDSLAEFKEFFGCKVYAFCLMTNHIHLIIDPGTDVENLAKLMKRVAGRQTRFVNRQNGRTGTLWEGRFRSSPIDSDNYLLACCRYIELNPVVARMCADPSDYLWSSCRSKVELIQYPWLDLDPLYLALGASAIERRHHYRKFLAEKVAEHEQEKIRKAVLRGQLTGDAQFVAEVELRINRRIGLRGPGRPSRPNK